MNKPLLSIIVPCYNACREIERCLRSLLHQTYKNLELIVVDDASTDDSVSRIEAMREDRIILIRHDGNRGASAARNTGLDVAQGEYVGFVDGDDFVDADYYERLYDAAVAEGADIVMAEMKIVASQETIVRYNGGGVERDFIKKWGLLHNGSPCDKLYKAALIERLNLRFYEGRVWEDNLFVLKAVYASSALAAIQGVFYHYVMHPQSTMHSSRLIQKRRDDGLFMAREMMDFAAEVQMNGAEKSAVARFILQNMTPKHDFSDVAYYGGLVKVLGDEALRYILKECGKLEGKVKRYKGYVRLLILLSGLLLLALLGVAVAWLFI